MPRTAAFHNFASTAPPTPTPPLRARHRDSTSTPILLCRKLYKSAQSTRKEYHSSIRTAKALRREEPRSEPPRPTPQKPLVFVRPNRKLRESTAFAIASAALSAASAGKPQESLLAPATRGTCEAKTKLQAFPSPNRISPRIDNSTTAKSQGQPSTHPTRRDIIAVVGNTSNHSENKSKYDLTAVPAQDTTQMQQIQQKIAVPTSISHLKQTKQTNDLLSKSSASQNQHQPISAQFRWEKGLRNVRVGLCLARFNTEVKHKSIVARANRNWNNVRKICNAAKSLVIFQIAADERAHEKAVAELTIVNTSITQKEMFTLASFPPMQRSVNDLQRLREFTTVVPFFQDLALSQESHLDLCNSMEWRHFPLGLTTVCQEGEVADGMYVVVIGSVLVRQLDQVAARRDAGCCFGMLGLEGKASKRTVTVVTSGKCSLFFLPIADYVRIVSHSYKSELEQRLEFLEQTLPLIVVEKVDTVSIAAQVQPGTRSRATARSTIGNILQSREKLRLGRLDGEMDKAPHSEKATASVSESLSKIKCSSVDSDEDDGWSGFGYDGKSDMREKIAHEDVRQLALISHKQVFHCGEYLLREGQAYDSSRFLMIVVKGNVQLQRRAVITNIDKSNSERVSGTTKTHVNTVTTNTKEPSKPASTATIHADGDKSSSSSIICELPSAQEGVESGVEIKGGTRTCITKRQHLRDIMTSSKFENDQRAAAQRTNRTATVRLCSLGPGEIICDYINNNYANKSRRGDSSGARNQRCSPFHRYSVLADSAAVVLLLSESDVMYSISREAVQSITKAGLHVPSRAAVQQLAVAHRRWEQFKHDTTVTMCANARLYSKSERHCLNSNAERIHFEKANEKDEDSGQAVIDSDESELCVRMEQNVGSVDVFAETTLDAQRRLNDGVVSEGALFFHRMRNRT